MPKMGRPAKKLSDRREFFLASLFVSLLAMKKEKSLRQSEIEKHQSQSSAANSYGNVAGLVKEMPIDENKG